MSCSFTFNIVDIENLCDFFLFYKSNSLLISQTFLRHTSLETEIEISQFEYSASLGSISVKIMF